MDRPAVTIYHGVDTSIYQPPVDRSSVRKELGLDDRPTIGVFGRIRPQKGTGDFVDALVAKLSEFPDWQVVFVGAVTEQHVAYKASLEAKLKAAGLIDRVTFVGFLEDFSSLPKWYQAVDIVGCVSRNEGFGVTCLEGMASECPVLATKAGAWIDIVDEGSNGWIAEANNPADLADALGRALSTSSDQRRAMGRKALESIHERFTIEHEADGIIAVYRDLLDRYGRSLPLDSTLQTNSARSDSFAATDAMAIGH